MNNKCTIGQFIGLLLGWATWLLCGCSDDFQTVPSSEGDKTDILVSLKILPPGMESPLTRSVLDPIGDEYELSTTEAEHRINTLTLIMMDVDNGKETFESSQTIIAPPKEGDTPYNVTFELKGISGTKRFYLGANMRDEHRKAFETDQRIFNADESSDGHNIVGSLMTVNHENDGKGSDILMTAAITTNKGSRDIVFDGTEGSEIKINNPVKLVRTVAKVLLTCVATNREGEYYVEVIDQQDINKENKENTGWIKLDNVNYMLNVLNRKTYMDYREEGTGKNAYLTDPNYAMSNFIERRDNGGYGLKDLANYQANFLYYDTQQMVEMLQETGERCITRKATLFDESKVKENDQEKHYTEGLYCPENMVHKNIDIPEEDFASVNRFVTTHVMVGAKYTPKKIWVNENDKLVEKTATTEDEALKLLEDLTDTEYLPGTFWQANDTKKYYSLSGMRKQLQDEPNTEFNRYDGGWGYYYTYIDGEANKEGTIDYANETRWGIKRNHYYILKVNQFVAPGSAFPGNEVMRIHSELIDWKDKGSSEVEIKVPQN